MNNPKLLIIDNAKNLSLLYKEELQEDGYEVDIANSVPEAKVLLNMKLYNLLILDTRLKNGFDHDGIWSKLNYNNNEIPVIIVSGAPMSEVEKKPLLYNAYIQKSSDMSPLKEKVKDILNKYFASDRDGIRVQNVS
jgi:DNA-binding NtrC family response regulator